MLYLSITRGELKRNTSIEELNNALQEVINYNPRLSLDIYDNLKGFISVDTKDNFTEYDVLKVLTKHCSYFKAEIDEEDYYESRFSSPYFIITSYYEWNGKNLVKRYRDFFGPICHKEDYNWILK